MATPVGPAPRDPDDPDLWEEWYDADGASDAGSGFGWPVRIVALVILLGLVGLFVLSI